MRGGGLRLLITLAFFITADLTPTTRGQGLEGDIQPSRIARSSPLRWGKRGGNNILRWGKREAVADADMEDEDGPHRERREAPLRWGKRESSPLRWGKRSAIYEPNAEVEDKRAPLRWGKRLTDVLDELQKREPLRWGKRSPVRFGKRGPSRFGKRGPSRFGKRSDLDDEAFMEDSLEDHRWSEE